MKDFQAKIVKIRKYKSNNEINNMICVMKKIYYLNCDTLTKNGILLSYISPSLDDILFGELNNFEEIFIVL